MSIKFTKQSGNRQAWGQVQRGGVGLVEEREDEEKGISSQKIFKLYISFKSIHYNEWN